MDSSNIAGPAQTRHKLRYALWRNLRNPLIIVVLIIVISASCSGQDHALVSSNVRSSPAPR